MRETLGLQGNALLVYAVIAGYSANGQGCYYGNLEYLCQLTGCSRRTVIRTLQELVDLKLVKKVGQWDGNDNRTCHYEVEKSMGANSTPIRVPNSHPMGDTVAPSQLPNQDKEEKCINNKYNNKYIHTLLEIGCDEQSIDDWLAARKQRRAPEVNQSVINCLLREADAANIPVSKAVEVAAEYGWQNFTAKWYLERVRPDEPKKKSGPRSVYERNLEQMRRGGLIDDNGNLV